MKHRLLLLSAISLLLLFNSIVTFMFVERAMQGFIKSLSIWRI